MGKVNRFVALASTAGLLSATALHGQTLPPDEGGLVTSLGQWLRRVMKDAL